MNDNNRPLDGITVLVTRPQGQGEVLCALIEEAGGRAVSFPVIVIQSLDDDESRQRLQSALEECSDFIFISRNAVACALELLPELPEKLAGRSVFAAGAGTRRVLAEAGVEEVLHTDSTRASEALLEMGELSEERIGNRNIAILRGEGGRELLRETLQQRGADVRLVELYRRSLPEVTPDKIDALWQDIPPDVIVITSTTGLENLVRLTPEAQRPRLFATQLVVISERLKEAALSKGFNVEPVVAAAASDEELVKAAAACTESMQMSEESKQQEEEEIPEESVELDLSGEETKPGGMKTAIVALLLALIALAAAATAFYFQFQSRDTSDARSRAVDSMQSQLEEMEHRLGDMASRRRAQVERIEELDRQQGKLGDRIDTLYRQQKRDNIDWAVAEIEHLMVIAEHSLTLQQDLATALAALKAADKRLRDLGAPGLTAVRRQLTSDINALRAVDDVDISGLSLYLADVAGRVEELPLPELEAPEPVVSEDDRAAVRDETKPAWKRLLSGIWQEIKSLVVITRSDDAGRALLMPEERYFLHQNLRLQLESARLAVFRRDTENFRASLDLAIGWLQEYFKTDSSAVSNVIQSLQEMRTLNLERDLPDISSSLESLRAWIRQRAQPATSPSANGEPLS